MPIKTNRNILDELQIRLQVRHVYVPELEQASKSLAGLPLKIEEERRTEVAIFMACYAHVSGDMADFERLYVLADQRRFEMYEFTNSMRLERLGKGILPTYILRTHEECARLFGAARLSAAA